jgi:hypothetical protein
MADVTIVPGRVGKAQLVIRLWNEDFTPLAAEKLTVTLTPPQTTAPPIQFSAEDHDGNWEIEGIALPQAGNWTVAVDATLADQRRLQLDAPIAIEQK